MLKICEKIRSLHSQEKMICIFSILVACILMLNVIVDIIHIGVSFSMRDDFDHRIKNTSVKIEQLEKEVQELKENN